MNKEKTLVTFFLLSYNQEKYITAAIKGALSQDYENLEIIFSDDASKDDTFKIMSEFLSRYTGPHTIRLIRNESNLGLINHINNAMKLASGELMVLSAGDDISHPNRTSMLVDEYLKNKKPMLLHSKAMAIDQQGQATGDEEPSPMHRRKMTVEEAALSRGIYLGASGAWSREFIEKYGPILYKNAHEDAVMGFRALLEDRIFYIDKPLLSYRVDTGITRTQLKSGKEGKIARIQDLRTQKDILSQRLHDIKDKEQWTTIAKTIKKRIIQLSVKIIYYTNQKEIYKSFFNSPILTLTALPTEIRLSLTKFRA